MSKAVKNTNLHTAKKVKNDEFYTKLDDIARELTNYKRFFKGKRILCNCDDPEWSEFFYYFVANFKFFGLKSLTCTHFEKDKPGYALVINKDPNKEGEVNYLDAGTKIPLKQNGDFRSDECLEFLKKSDIVITNPPFSLFRSFIKTMTDYNKDFIIIGNKNAITYKDVFSLIKEGKVKLGKTSPKEFLTERPPVVRSLGSEPPRQPVKVFGNIGWFTTFDISFCKDDIHLFREYKGNEHLYPKYDNYDAINVNKLVDIPVDYDGVMGVPITFLDKSFYIAGTEERIVTEIVKARKGDDGKDLRYRDAERESRTSGFSFVIEGLDRYVEGNTLPGKRMFIGSKEFYARILVKRVRIDRCHGK